MQSGLEVKQMRTTTHALDSTQVNSEFPTVQVRDNGRFACTNNTHVLFSRASARCTLINQNYIFHHYTRHTHMLQQTTQLFIYEYSK